MQSRISMLFVIQLAILLLYISPTGAYNWLALALSGAHTHSSSYNSASSVDQRNFNMLCQQLPGLNPVQQAICIQHPFAMPSVGKGARESIVECQTQFRHERWNCSERVSEEDGNDTVLGYRDLLGRTMRAENRETAFISAITSAGIVHAVTRGCSTGNLTECGCDNRFNTGQTVGPNNETWSWGGCSDNVRFGVKFAKQFLDRYEKDQFDVGKRVANLMNLHNNLVGRRSVVNLMRKQCRCHGVSGSCEFRTCWQQMPPFDELGRVLKQRYNHFTVQVARRARKRLRRKERADRKLPLRDSELVFVRRSPNYCERNDTLGILGTQGRRCNQTSLNADSCHLLCCGRGYDTREEVQMRRCSCKFVWCCYVKCKTCKQTVQVHSCK